MEQSPQTYWSKPYIHICIGHMLLFLSFQSLLPTIPIYLADHGSSNAMIGLVTAMITLAAVLVRLFTGHALEQYSRRSIILVSSLVFAYGGIAFSFSLSPGWVIANALIFGAGWGVVTTAYTTIVAELVPAGRQGAGIGTFILFALGSMAAGPFIGMGLYNRYGASVLFGYASLVALSSIVVFLTERYDVHLSRDPASSASPDPADAAHTAATAGGRTSILGRVFERTSLLPSGLIALFTFCYGGIISFIGLYGHDLGVQNTGLFFLFANVSAILIRSVAGRLFDTRGHAPVIFPGILLGIASYLTLSMAGGPTMFFVAAVLFGLSFGAVQPYSLAWTVQRAGPRRQGAANSTFLMGMDGGITVGSTILGILSPLWGLPLVFRFSALVLVVQLAIYGASLRKARPTRSAAA